MGIKARAGMMQYSFLDTLVARKTKRLEIIEALI